MPGISMLGDSRLATRSRPTSLPAEARSLGRLMRLLHSPPLAAEALLEGLEQVSDSSRKEFIRQSLLETIVSLQGHDQQTEDWLLPPKVAEHRMSLSMYLAVDKAFSLPQNHANKPSNTEEEEDDEGSLHRTTSDLHDVTPAAALVSDSSSVESEGDDATTTSTTVVMRDESVLVDDAKMTSTTVLMRDEAILVDDATTASTIVMTDESIFHDDPRANNHAVKFFWATLLESFHLQVTSWTTAVWGTKKTYEIYKLSGPAHGLGNDTRQALQAEFQTLFHGGGDQSSCRTYALQRGEAIYIQMNIGKWFDFHDERNRSVSGEKKKKKGNEFVAVIIPGLDLIALTASRAPSFSRFTPFVLPSLDAVLSRRGSGLQDMIPPRVGDWCGTDPLELLESARKAQTGQAVGRFAKFASETIADPLLELQTISMASLLDRTDEQQRILIGNKHGRPLAQLNKLISEPTTTTGNKLVAVNTHGILVDASASKNSSRKRARDDDLGHDGDNPCLHRICWRWTGSTTAASACWLADDAIATAETWDLPKTEFKCGVMIEGTNIFEGLRSMAETGLAKAPIPDFVKEVPTVGSSTITVNHGLYADTDSFAAV